jgi:hypothetical protein
MITVRVTVRSLGGPFRHADHSTVVTRYGSNTGMNVVNLAATLSGLHGAWNHWHILKKFSARVEAQRPHCRAEFHGRRLHGGGYDDNGMVVRLGARHDE